jgi:hypothetical protein
VTGPGATGPTGPGEATRRRRAGEALPDALVDPHPDRRASRAALAAHRLAVADGADGYVDPDTGLFCFTAAHHWAKARCCELGCRHCPWVDADARLAAAAD